MTYKEFYYWLDGFMTNRNWTTITQVDIETIQDKLKTVKGDDNFGIAKPYTVPVPINPIIRTDDPMAPPFYPSVKPDLTPDWTYRPDQMPYYGNNTNPND
jgi:hypothetical protein